MASGCMWRCWAGQLDDGRRSAHRVGKQFMADRRRKRRPPQRVLVALELLAPYTAEYLSVLHAALPGLEALTRLEGAEGEQLRALVACVRAAVDQLRGSASNAT